MTITYPRCEGVRIISPSVTLMVTLFTRWKWRSCFFEIGLSVSVR